jgi:hypothetical protein
MRNGVPSTDFQVDRVTQKGIAAVKDGVIRAFDRRYFYTIDQVPDEPPRYMAPSGVETP